MAFFDLGGRLNHIFGRTSHNEVQKIRGLEPMETEYVSGCCMLIRKEVFEKIGYFDEDFFLYYEDVDFCLRAKEKGFYSYVNPSSIISHRLSISVVKLSDLATFHQIRSAILFGKKFFHNPVLKIMNFFFILFQVLVFLKANPKGGMGGVRALSTYVIRNR